MRYYLITLYFICYSFSVNATPWESMLSPTNQAIESIGSYANGCLEGANALPLTGKGYQVVRSERKRYFAHSDTIHFIQDLAISSEKDLNKQLLIADMSLPQGGRFSHGHSSHQTGLDVDIWLRLLTTPLTKKDLKKPYSISLVDKPTTTIKEQYWQPEHFELIKMAAKDERVARIFVNSAIKEKLCEEESKNTEWLRKVRPWWGHSAHMHVRLNCPKEDKNCINQAEPPEGDGCGHEAKSWRLNPTPQKKRASAPVMPKQCSEMLNALN
ncbi:penicillin-insensitive murein endopeptidase [Aliivibrio sp. 1S128]|uniref:penicillin-insensitive murein endopeptidase n=1 Tax=Aliivibrio sp. 1S128 TaxID=1840085 RepID=UPI00080E547F|nr:penicillin-insensitive murein endopeptidase [Aliivibrio sp. 1S128]OCH21473.1 penicillin-insensitive murein endopeptidase [Aliivibrio sp. 1S128]